MRQRVTALIIRDKKILLVKEIIQGTGYLYTPGGGIEEGESHEDALARECMEELGMTLCASRYLFSHDLITIISKTEQQNHCYLVDAKGEPCAGNEIADAFWLSYEEICARSALIFGEKEMVFDRLKAEGIL